MHCLRLPPDKLLVNLLADFVEPLFSALRPILAGSELFL
jgi:hypothetical protein